MINPATVITLIVFGAISALLGWRRGTRALYRRSLGEPNLGPGETKRDYERRLRRRRKVSRIVGTLLYCLVGLAIGFVLLSVVTLRR